MASPKNYSLKAHKNEGVVNLERLLREEFQLRRELHKSFDLNQAASNLVDSGTNKNFPIENRNFVRNKVLMFRIFFSN